ncbi:MAG: hypothetical protein M1833_003761 [Piccolia ochrophora]|nr:MAG: hypothetical protein M1833_003761 [Piccolia ochrophora]
MAAVQALTPMSPQPSGLSASSRKSSTGGASYANSNASELAGGHKEWRQRIPAFTPPSSRMANPKASPDSTAVIAAQQASLHSRLHKRASSTPSVPHSPSLPSPLYDHHPHDASTLPSPQAVVRGSSSPILQHSPTSPNSKPKTTIRPFLRKLKSHDGNALDLSRSAADADGHGLFESTYGSGSRTAADVPFATAGKRGQTHNRSTSGTSQFSTGTTGSTSRQYVHPMRQTPRPYTPPIAQSYQTSMLGSEYSGDGTGQGMDEEEHLRQIVREASYRPSASYSPSQGQPPPLRIHTNNSSTRLVSGSQTNLASTPMSFRARGETISPIETGSPISRSSMDRAFKMRSRDNSTPASRAASIRAARQAFEEKEAAKDQKAEEEERKAAERASRKREKREEADRKRAASEARRREKGGPKPSTTRKKASATDEKPEQLAGTAYANLQPADNVEPVVGQGPKRTNTATTASAQSTWVGFMIWLKTRFLKLGRKMRGRP